MSVFKQKINGLCFKVSSLFWPGLEKNTHTFAHKWMFTNAYCLFVQSPNQILDSLIYIFWY